MTPSDNELSPSVIPMHDRRYEKLPPRRDSHVLEYEHDGQKYIVSFSFFEDSSVAEIFITAGKGGAAVNIVARECATIFSIARRYGAPLDVIYDSLPKLEDGKPAGPVGMALARAISEEL